MSQIIKIHLADDHQLLLDSMNSLIETNPNYCVTGHSVNGNLVLEKVEEEGASILIMDINMPQKDGIEVMKEYSLRKYPFSIIILSSYDDLKLIKEMMNLGAKAYLTKQCAGDNIIEAIQVVTDGEEYFCETVRNKILNTFANKNPNFNIGNNDHIFDKFLSERELQIIKLIALEYKSEDISEELFISVNTVNTHRKNLIKKLNVKSSIGLVTYAIKNNLIIINK
jgi:DNA-binding NarL/FixJ family response regulator